MMVLLERVSPKCQFSKTQIQPIEIFTIQTTLIIRSSIFLNLQKQVKLFDIPLNHQNIREILEIPKTPISVWDKMEITKDCKDQGDPVQPPGRSQGRPAFK